MRAAETKCEQVGVPKKTACVGNTGQLLSSVHIHPLFTESHSRPIAAETEDQATQPDIYLPLEKKKNKIKTGLVFPGE